MGKGSVVVPLFSYHKVTKMTWVWQGKARHEAARENEPATLHFSIFVNHPEPLKSSEDNIIVNTLADLSD